MNTADKTRSLLALAFKAVGLGTAAAAIVLTTVGFASTELYVILLGMGLFCLALAAIVDHPAR